MHSVQWPERKNFIWHSIRKSVFHLEKRSLKGTPTSILKYGKEHILLKWVKLTTCLHRPNQDQWMDESKAHGSCTKLPGWPCPCWSFYRLYVARWGECYHQEYRHQTGDQTRGTQIFLLTLKSHSCHWSLGDRSKGTMLLVKYNVLFIYLRKSLEFWASTGFSQQHRTMENALSLETDKFVSNPSSDTCYLTLLKLLDFSEPHFLHLPILIISLKVVGRIKWDTISHWF